MLFAFTGWAASEVDPPINASLARFRSLDLIRCVHVCFTIRANRVTVGHDCSREVAAFPIGRVRCTFTSPSSTWYFTNPNGYPLRALVACLICSHPVESDSTDNVG